MDANHREVATDVVVAGSGPAGLAVGACLRKAGIDFEMLERDQQVGSSWRRHYDRLHLHTDRAHSSLPHVPLPRTYPRYPSRQQVIDYLEAYARAFSLAPRFGEEVLAARPLDGGWEVKTHAHRYRARAVVMATGYNADPVRPRWPGMETYRGTLLHSSEYRSGARFKGQNVLVVGFGNSGGEIAIDLFEQGARPSIVVRGPVNLLPRELLGLPLMTWAQVLVRLPIGLADAVTAPLVRFRFGDISRLGLRKSPEGPIAQVVRGWRIPLVDVGTVDLIRQHHLSVRPGIRAFTETGVTFEDGNGGSFDAVVLATGYRSQLATLLDPTGVIDASGRPVEKNGDTKLQGLYLCGFNVSPTGMFRDIALEAQHIAKGLSRQLAVGSRISGNGTPRPRVDGTSLEA